MRTARQRQPTSDVASRLATQVLVCDGAMGTMLHAGGVSLDRSLPELNLSHPDLVRSIHRAYIAAGADIIETNTFGASRLRLARYGLA
ncbi:MAG TPA: homocysteine S-methyltransferase family protein, partial [Povalibacter sp.]|nr:homocysteine S-methyltransferase family protein [Povalibacter sp.]